MIKPVKPNPVSGGIVHFEYVITHQGMVSIILYDELGREAARVIDRRLQPAGAYTAEFDARGLPSGSYTYRFQLDSHRAISGNMVVSN